MTEIKSTQTVLIEMEEQIAETRVKLMRLYRDAQSALAERLWEKEKNLLARCLEMRKSLGMPPEPNIPPIVTLTPGERTLIIRMCDRIMVPQYFSALTEEEMLQIEQLRATI